MTDGALNKLVNDVITVIGPSGRYTSLIGFNTRRLEASTERSPTLRYLRWLCEIVVFILECSVDVDSYVTLSSYLADASSFAFCRRDHICRVITLRDSEAATQCIVIGPVCVCVCVCMCVCGSVTTIT